MPHIEKVALAGVIEHVFAHRFTLVTDRAVELADLGPKGLEAFPLAAGALVSIEGERRPSEIKVTRIGMPGAASVTIEHKKPHHKAGDRDDGSAPDPSHALSAVTAAGWEANGEPRRKPKHVEILARRAGGAWIELHVDAAGDIYKQKPADAEKWQMATA